MCKALRELWKDKFDQIVEEKMKQVDILFQQLEDEGRYDVICRISADKAYRTKWLQEAGITGGE